MAGRSVWRIDSALAPSIASEARRLRVPVDTVRLSDFDHEMLRACRMAQRDGRVNILGPWELDIDLQPTAGADTT